MFKETLDINFDETYPKKVKTYNGVHPRDEDSSILIDVDFDYLDEVPLSMGKCHYAFLDGQHRSDLSLAIAINRARLLHPQNPAKLVEEICMLPKLCIIG